jgi:hypothetical protein
MFVTHFSGVIMDGFSINEFERVFYNGEPVEYIYNSKTGVVSVRDDLAIEDYVRIGIEIGHQFTVRHPGRLNAVPVTESVD